MNHVLKGATIALLLSGTAGLANESVKEAIANPAQWAIQTGDYANTRYSTLDQINKSNVGDLRVAWTFSTGVLRGHEGSPLVIGDIMYVHTPFPNNVFALDLNNDGTINDGKELFGPESGNGFSDLANYDTDHNNWIDENDAIYDKLRIWSKDENGKDYLFALGEKGVGAIYLGNVSTSYALKDANNQTNAQLQRSGIFLNEDGSAGTVQHIDLVV